MVNDQHVIGEIVEASTTEFLAEAKELHSPPSFGSFVKVPLSTEEIPNYSNILALTDTVTESEDPFEDPADKFRQMAGSFGSEYHSLISGQSSIDASTGLAPAIYSVVYQASTGPSDPTKRERAYWKDEHRLREEQPEISEWLLVTNFKAIVIGFSLSGRIRQFLPPKPPRLHSFVYPCTNEEIVQITRRMDFLRTLVNSHIPSLEEVLAACIREACVAHGSDPQFLVIAGKELANLFKNDYDRLQAIIRRVMP
jgi:hypothetical protein